MNTQWVIRTDGDPLKAVQALLYNIQVRTGLTGMIIPYRAPGTAGVKLLLAEEREHFAGADPFAPLMNAKTVESVANLLRQYPNSNLGVVLRPCEARALFRMADRNLVQLDHVLTIGVDCLATYPEDEYEWRARQWGGGDHLTREALHFARQGGILAYRYRPACQMCTLPLPEDVDLVIGVLGLPAYQIILVTARNESIAGRLHLPDITDYVAPPSVIDEHEAMRTTLIERRNRARNRIVCKLEVELPANVDSFMAHLANCAPCQACLEACPIYIDELSSGRSGGVSRDAVSQWLASCTACGLCEDACPKRLPLTAIVNRISWDLIRDWITE